MGFESAGTGAGFRKLFVATVADRKNIVERKRETRAIPPWCAHMSRD